jgi:hypothetical protein
MNKLSEPLNVEGFMKKRDLPQKNCPICERPFTWRKKWEKNWENVKYCSKACSSKRNERKSQAS